MSNRISLLFALCAALMEAEVIDRIAVIVGDSAIKLSDIQRDLRTTAFLNNEPMSSNVEARKKTAERLIDQAIIRDQIARGGYALPTNEDSNKLLAQIQKDRFSGSAALLRQELQRYRITEGHLRTQLLWQLTVLRFIDQRFRPGVLVSDEEARAYYDQNQAELRRKYPKNSMFEALEPEIRITLEGERIDRNFNQWIVDSRKRVRIDYKQEAFQ